MNEIALLKRLNGNNRIIQLVDSELRAGPGGSKGHLLLVMECGEIGGCLALHFVFFDRTLWADGVCRFVETFARTAEGAHEYGLDIVLLATSKPNHHYFMLR